MAFTRLVTAVFVVILTTTVAGAQTVTKTGEALKASATIQAINQTDRMITCKTDDGQEDTMWVPPSITRFNELKVGDKINLSYYESAVFQVRKPGDPPLKPTDSAAITPGSGALPSGTVGRQATASVTVKSINPAAPSLTVTTSDGKTITRKVENKANLNGVKVGDRIDITYSQAVLASVERK